MELSCLIIRNEARGTARSKYPAVVCTAAGKPFRGIHEAILLPNFDHVRIKELSRLSDGRYLVRLKGVARKRIVTGGILVAGGYPLYRSRAGYGIARRAIPPGSYSARGGLFREYAFPAPVTVSARGGGYLLSCETDVALVPGARYRLVPEDTPEGKTRKLPFELIMCFPREPGKREREHVGPLLEQLQGEPSISRILAANLELAGWVALPKETSIEAIRAAASSLHPAATEDSKEVVDLTGPDGTRYLLARAFLSRLSRSIEKEAVRTGGARPTSIAGHIGVPRELIEAVASEVGERVIRDHGLIIAAGPRAGLSPMEKGILESLRRAVGTQGFVRGSKGTEGKLLERLVRLRAAVRIGDRFCAADTYESLTRRLIEGRNPGDPISVPEARRILGLPREQVISFLEALDSEGVLRREAQVHRVVRGPKRGAQ